MTTEEELRAFRYRVRFIRIEVEDSPPWKQTPADTAEASRQQARRKKLQDAVRAEVAEAIGDGPLDDPVCLSITYHRVTGRSDAANVIGGIADALEGIAYVNDRLVTEVHYVEETGPTESYSVTVSFR